MAQHTVVIRTGPPPAHTVLMIRGGARSIDTGKLADDAERSFVGIGILGVSVQASLADEDLNDAWSRSRILAGRAVVWWTTAGMLRQEDFPLLATGADERHYTVVLAHTGVNLLSRLAGLFRREDR